MPDSSTNNTNYLLVLLKGLTPEEQIEELESVIQHLKCHGNKLSCGNDCMVASPFVGDDVEIGDVEKVVMTFAKEESFSEYKLTFDEPKD